MVRVIGREAQLRRAREIENEAPPVVEKPPEKSDNLAIQSLPFVFSPPGELWATRLAIRQADARRMLEMMRVAAAPESTLFPFVERRDRVGSDFENLSIAEFEEMVRDTRGAGTPARITSVRQQQRSRQDIPRPNRWGRHQT